MVRSQPLFARQFFYIYLLMSDKPSKMLLFCNDVVWDGQSHHAAAEMLKESAPGSELW